VDISIENLSEVEQEIAITLPQEELQPHFDRAYERYRPKAEVKGFRKGKVPLPMIRKLYGEAIEYDSLDTVANDVFRVVMEERAIHPIGQPSMVDMDYKRGEHFRFRIKYEVHPAITLGDYRGLAVEKPVHRVTEEELERELHQLLRLNATLTPVERVDGAVAVVTADVQELDEAGTPLIGRTTKDARFTLDDHTLAPEIKEALQAAETGGEIRVQFESRHGDHTHPVRLAMTVKGIERVDLPPFDDALVQKVTGGKTLTTGEFRESLQKDLERYWDEQGNRSVDEAIAAEIVRRHEFTVPESMVGAMLDSYLDDIRGRSRDRKLPAGFDEKKWREDNRASAVWQAKWMLLRNRIAEAEGIGVTDEDLAALAAKEAERTQIPQDRLLEYYKQSGAVGERILGDKLMTVLRGAATIHEREIAAPAER
jgi:trigger factor